MNILPFAPSDLIVACTINNHNVHDSQRAEQGGVYEKLEMMHVLTSGKGVTGSAFSRGYGLLTKSCQILPTDDLQKNMLMHTKTTLMEKTTE